MNLYLLISICALFDAFIDAFETQHVNIWTNSMDNNNGWMGYNNFNFTLKSDKCGTGPCGYVTADNNGPSYIQKSTNITFYSSVIFQVDIKAYNQEQVDYCEIWYNFDNIIYTKYSAWNHGIYKKVKINLPQSTITKIISIRLQVIGNHTSCYWDNTMLRGIRIPVKNSNITTDTILFSNSTHTNIYSFYSISECVTIALVFCIVIVIMQSTYTRINCKNKKDSIEYSLSMTTTYERINIQNLQRAIMEIMSSLQLSEHDIHFYKSKYPMTNTTSDQRIIPLEKGNYIGMNYENILTNTCTASSANYIHTIYCGPSDDIALERPSHHSYPTVTITPKSSTLTYDNRRQFAQITALKHDTYDGKNSLSLTKLECLLNELEMEISHICIDDNKYEYYSNGANNDSISDTITELETISETNWDWDSTSMHVNIGVKYKETFL